MPGRKDREVWREASRLEAGGWRLEAGCWVLEVVVEVL